MRASLTCKQMCIHSWVWGHYTSVKMVLQLLLSRQQWFLPLVANCAKELEEMVKLDQVHERKGLTAAGLAASKESLIFLPKPCKGPSLLNQLTAASNGIVLDTPSPQITQLTNKDTIKIPDTIPKHPLLLDHGVLASFSLQFRNGTEQAAACSSF